MTKTLTVLASAAMLVVVAVPASAQAAAHKGRTKGGSTITLSVAGKRASSLRTLVPAICVETTGTYKTRAGAKIFQPPGSFAFGGERKAKALQPAAMNMAAKATKNYTVSVRSAGRNRVAGDLKVNFSFIRPGLTIYQMEIWLCQGSTSFTAARR